MIEEYSSGAAASLRKPLDGPSLAPGNGAVALVDVRNQFIHKDIFAKTIFLSWEIVPAHWSAVGKDIQGGPQFASADGLVHKCS